MTRWLRERKNDEQEGRNPNLCIGNEIEAIRHKEERGLWTTDSPKLPPLPIPPLVLFSASELETATIEALSQSKEQNTTNEN